MLILNEEKYAKDIYDGKVDSVKSVLAKVGYITRYFMYSLGQSDAENYKNTVSWMKIHHNNFDESCYSKLISDAVRNAHKRPFYNVENIKITKLELEVISSLNDLRAEKILFVLLCMAKQQSVAYKFTGGLVKYSITELCKIARVSVPADDREYILYNILQHGFIRVPKKNDTQCLIVNFVDDDGEAAMTLNEIDCQELAYVYLNWKNENNGYGRCELCGRLMKKPKKNSKRFCEVCTPQVGDISDDIKVIKCIDCGKLVYVTILNTKTCRCNECQSVVDETLNRLASRERMKRYRESH